MKDRKLNKIRNTYRSVLKPDFAGPQGSYAAQRRKSAALIALLFAHHRLIPKDHPAVNPDSPAPVYRLVWIAWELLDLRLDNLWRIFVFASFAVPWLLIWLTVIAFLAALIARWANHGGPITSRLSR